MVCSWSDPIGDPIRKPKFSEYWRRYLGIEPTRHCSTATRAVLKTEQNERSQAESSANCWDLIFSWSKNFSEALILLVGVRGFEPPAPASRRLLLICEVQFQNVVPAKTLVSI